MIKNWQSFLEGYKDDYRNEYDITPGELWGMRKEMMKEVVEDSVEIIEDWANSVANINWEDGSEYNRTAILATTKKIASTLRSLSTERSIELADQIDRIQGLINELPSESRWLLWKDKVEKETEEKRNKLNSDDQE